MALIVLLWLGIGNASAQTFPKLTARVVDDAHLLQPAQQAALEAKLRQVQQTTGHQVFLATIANLQGYPLEDYGYKLLRAWAPGSKDKNDGLVIFLAPNEPVGHRGPRIEVGYGLEPLVTDAFASEVARNIMTPKLRAGDIAGALNDGVDAIAAQIKLTPEEAAKRAAQAPPAQTQTQGTQRSHSGGSLFFWLILFFFVGLPLLRSMGGRRYSGGGSGGSGLGNVILWSALSSLGNSGSNSGWGGGGSSWGGGSDSSGGSDFSGGDGGSGGGGGASGDW